MSTTVIASTHGSSLYLWPARREVDLDALREVLKRNGQELLDNAVSGGNLEFIAAEGLDHAHANRLASDLRSLGLTVRVVNKTGITTSSRLSNAIAFQFMACVVAVLGVLTVAPALGMVLMGAATGLFAIAAVVPAFLSIVVGLLTLTNGIRIGANGTRLPVAGVPARALAEAEPGVVSQIAAMKDDLPAAIIEPLLETARELHAKAAANPGSDAAAELRALTEELARSEDEATVEKAKTLRNDVRRAQLAAREASGRRKN
jgi:hypothetical protein